MCFHLGMKRHFNLWLDMRVTKPGARFINPGASLSASSTVTPGAETPLERTPALRRLIAGTLDHRNEIVLGA